MVRRFKPPIRTNIGRARVPSSDTSSQAEFERSIRDQMNAILKNYLAWTSHMNGVSADVLEAALRPTFVKSQQYVPKDTRALMRSGYLEKRTFRGRSVVEIGYGRGGNPHYAAQVHEDLEANHPNEGEQAKFLERPLLEDEAAIQQRITQGMREASGV